MKFVVKIHGSAWLTSEVTIEASDETEAKRIAHERFDELEWEIVEMDRPVAVSATAVAIPTEASVLGTPKE
jgi:hypothetical protein